MYIKINSFIKYINKYISFYRISFFICFSSSLDIKLFKTNFYYIFVLNYPDLSG